MAQYNVAPLERLVEQFERMPGIGHKTAQRLAYYVLNLSKTQADELANAVVEAHTKIHYCSRCCNLTDRELCPVCANEARDHSQICVVETPRDATAVENTHEYKGVYHVLHGSISPLNGVGPDDLTIKQLIARLGENEVAEVIMATNPTVEGDATALYISKLLKPMGVKVTRLAYGIPVGKKARHDYFVEESYEAGIELCGTEVKSIRQGRVNLKDSWCSVDKGELFVNGMHISPFEQGNIFNRDPMRVRKLLMHKKEINRLFGIVKQTGYSLIPLSLYFKGSRVKVQVGLCKGKKLYDKREDMAKRAAKRDMERAIKEQRFS